MLLLQGHTNSVRSLAFSADGLVLASASDDGSIRLWDARQGRLIGKRAPDVRTEYLSAIFGLAFAPDRRFLYSCGASGRFVAWDLHGVESPRVLLVSHRSLVALAVSPDGELAAVGGDRSSHPDEPGLRVWSTSAQKEISPSHLPEPTRAVWSLAFAPHGRTLAIGQNNGQVLLWDATRNQMQPPLAHTVAVRALAFSPDGVLAGDRAIESLAFTPDGTLATGCIDSTIRLWDVYTGQEKARFDWRLGRIHAVAVAPDGMTAAAGGETGDIVLWDVDV